MQKDDVSPQDPQNAGTPHESASASASRAQVDAERIKELRARLYSRGSAQEPTVRHELPRHEIHDTMEAPTPKVEVERVAAQPTPPRVDMVAKTTLQAENNDDAVDAVSYSEPMAYPSRRKSFRKKIALIGIAFFVIAVGVASFIMLTGNNTISGDNISITASGPISVGGGEEFAFQVAVANQNAVPIQSATLIIEYPKGSHSIEDVNKEVSIERKSLDTVGAGELINVPFKVRIFGEENEEKEIKVSIDYRVAGSNATFDKEATPLRFKVSTSPIVMTFDSVKTIASGQEMELKLTVQSNSPTPLTDVLIKAAYPEGFDYSESVPETLSGEDTWKIATLKPAEKKVITIRGLIMGYENETRKFNATAGVANTTDANELASMLAKAQTEVMIEPQFLTVGVVINNSKDETVIINTDETALIDIEYKNALDTTIYDGKVLVELDGNALNEFEVKVDNGFYDSSKNTITWDSVDEKGLKEILPGKSSRLSFNLTPREDIGRTPEMNLTVTVQGQRVFENRAPQELKGIAKRVIKVESVPVISSTVLHSNSPFTNTGPVPPIAEKVTQYAYVLTVKSGTNDITGAEITAIVPQYVSWLDLVTEGDTVTYTPSTRTMKWTIGDMDANTVKEVAVQVSFLPSLSQVGSTPTILESQRFKATDRFTGTTIRTDHPALTTNLPNESDGDAQDGKVRAK